MLGCHLELCLDNQSLFVVYILVGGAADHGMVEVCHYFARFHLWDDGPSVGSGIDVDDLI